MKNIISFASISAIGLLFILPSCASGTDSWPEVEKEAFLTECVKNMNEPGIDAEDSCSCMLDKVIKEYPTPKKAIKITMEWMIEEAQGCL